MRSSLQRIVRDRRTAHVPRALSIAFLFVCDTGAHGMSAPNDLHMCFGCHRSSLDPGQPSREPSRRGYCIERCTRDVTRLSVGQSGAVSRSPNLRSRESEFQLDFLAEKLITVKMGNTSLGIADVRIGNNNLSEPIVDGKDWRLASADSSGQPKAPLTAQVPCPMGVSYS
jgi:hypothetical protein